MNEPRKPTVPIDTRPVGEKAEVPPMPDGCIWGCLGFTGLVVVLILIGLLRRLFLFAFW